MVQGRAGHQEPLGHSHASPATCCLPPGGALATGQVDSVCLVSGPDTAVQRLCAVHEPSPLPLVVPNKFLTILQGCSLKSTSVKSAQLPRDNVLALPWFFTSLSQEFCCNTLYTGVAGCPRNSVGALNKGHCHACPDPSPAHHSALRAPPQELMEGVFTKSRP